jgi:predicted peptidase
MPTKVLVVLFAALMASCSENKTPAYWEKWNFERAQKLAQLFEARTFVNNQGEQLLYRLLKPLNYDAKKKYPLVVCLHHGGVHGNDNIAQLSSEPAPLLSNPINRSKYPAFLFVPQCPKGSQFGGIPNFSIDSLVFEAIGALEKEFKIDTSRRYVAGISGGGFGTWHFICTRPKMFAAAIPICGGGDPGFAKQIKDIPVWAFHGEKDTNVPVAYSKDMIEAMKKEGGNPKYTEFACAGHYIWDRVENTPGLLDWLFAQKRYMDRQ